MIRSASLCIMKADQRGARSGSRTPADVTLQTRSGPSRRPRRLVSFISLLSSHPHHDFFLLYALTHLFPAMKKQWLRVHIYTPPHTHTCSCICNATVSKSDKVKGLICTNVYVPGPKGEQNGCKNTAGRWWDVSSEAFLCWEESWVQYQSREYI